MQGFAVAAAPRFLPDGGVAEDISVMGEMPCPINKATPDEEDNAVKADCCDASCPNMTTCMLGSMAANNTLVFAVAFVSLPESAIVPVADSTRSPEKLLRPPITLHV